MSRSAASAGASSGAPATRPFTAVPARRRFGGSLAYLGVVPFFGFLTVFLVMPIVVNLWMTFRDKSGAWSLDSLIRLAKPQFLDAYWQTAQLSALTAVLGGALGFVLAWALAALERPAWLRRFVHSFIPVASQFAGVPLAFAFVATIGAQGYITVAISDGTGIPVTDYFRLSSFAGLVLVYLYFQIPLMAVLMLPALAGVRAEWRESVQSLGGGSARYIFTVLVPILAPSIGGALIMLFANAYSAYATAWALTGGQLNLVPLQIGNYLGGDVLSDSNFGAALATGMMVVIGFAMLVRWLLTRRATRWLR